MVYLEISGVRLDQTTLLAVIEGTAAHFLWVLLLAIINCRCLRPLAPGVRGVNAWRFHTTVYAILAIATEVMWVQLGLVMGPKRIHENAIACEWSEEHLMGWTMFQVLSLLSTLVVCTYCQRAPVGHMVTSYIGLHAMALMAFSMMGISEQGACASDVFPLVTAMLGMALMCCCFPWHAGAWGVPYPREAPQHPMGPPSRWGGDTDERETLTCWGWRVLERHLRLNPRPYRGDAEVGILDAAQHDQSRTAMMLFGETGIEEGLMRASGRDGHVIAEEIGRFEGEERDSDSLSDDEDDEEREEQAEPPEIVTAKGDGRGKGAIQLTDLSPRKEKEKEEADSIRLEPFVTNPKEWSSSSSSSKKGEEKAEKSV